MLSTWSATRSTRHYRLERATAKCLCYIVASAFIPVPWPRQGDFGGPRRHQERAKFENERSTRREDFPHWLERGLTPSPRTKWEEGGPEAPNLRDWRELTSSRDLSYLGTRLNPDHIDPRCKEHFNATNTVENSHWNKR